MTGGRGHDPAHGSGDLEIERVSGSDGADFQGLLVGSEVGEDKPDHPATPPVHAAATSPAHPSAPKHEQGGLAAVRTSRDYGSLPNTLFRMLLGFQTACRSGQFTVVAGGEHWSAYLDEQGRIADFDLDLVGCLIAAGLLNETARSSARQSERLSAALARSHSAGARFEIPEATLLRPVVLSELVRRLKSLMGQQGMTYFFDPTVQVFDVGLSVPISVYARRLLDDIAAGMSISEIEPLYKTRLDFAPCLDDADDWSVAALSLSTQEARLVERALPKRQSLRDLLTFSPLSKVQTYRFLFTLEGLRLLRFSRGVEDLEGEDEIVQRLEKRLRQAEQGHFEALGLHVTAHHASLREALEGIIEEYGSERLGGVSPRAEAVGRELIKRARAAVGFLSDQTRRTDYRRSLHTDTELAGFAQLLVDKMKLARLRGERGEAQRFQQVALELCPRVVRDALRESETAD